ncbi:MAG: asparagine synthetase B family protein [Solirubrobacterales bacterium]
MLGARRVRPNRASDEVRCGPGAGLGHSRSAAASVAASRQRAPDAGPWITADVRLDDPNALVRELTQERPAGEASYRAADDEALLLHAYRTWGAAMVEHIRGDFAFVVWDRARNLLFAARDHLGVRPLYYAVAQNRLLVASELAMIRADPAISDDLDELAVADFLLFGHPQNPDATVFRSIRRLPAGHQLTWSRGHRQVRRYWRLKAPDELPEAEQEEILGEFEHALLAAVEDRLGNDDVAVMMSGGLDSPCIAALAREGLPPGRRLSAATVSWEDLFPDDDPRYARLSADALGLPLDLHRAGTFRLLEESPTGALPPQPFPDPSLGSHQGLLVRLAERAPVALTGIDGDAISTVSFAAHFEELTRALRFGRAAADVWSYTAATRRIPPLGIRTRLRRGRSGEEPPEFPAWIERDLVARHDLEGRWREFFASDEPRRRGSRGGAAEMLEGASLRALFDSYDEAASGRALQVMHPFLDLRVIEAVFAAPPIPWCVDKELIRRVAERRLPRAVARRPKITLPEDPLAAMIARFGMKRPIVCTTLKRFVNVEILPAAEVAVASGSQWQLLWTYNLDRWLELHESGMTEG